MFEVVGDLRRSCGARRGAPRRRSSSTPVVEVDLVVLAESIDAVEESSAALDDLVGLVGPVDVVGRRPGEEVEEAQPVGADGLVVLLGRDEVALGLGHLRAGESNHALGEQSREGLARESRREADVDRSPSRRSARRAGARSRARCHRCTDRPASTCAACAGSNGRIGRPGVGVAQEVPRRVDRRCPSCRSRGRPVAPQTRAGGVAELLVGRERRLTGLVHGHVVGREDRQLVIGHGHDAAVSSSRRSGIGLPQNRWREINQSRRR